MKKYFQLAKLTLQEFFVYRLNFYLWRFRNFVSFLALLFFWLAIYGNRSQFMGYTRPQILTYLVGIALLRGLVFSTRTADLAAQIRNGDLNKILLIPLNLTKSLLSRDLADKTLNTVFSLFEIALVLFLFDFQIIFPSNPITFLLFFLITFLSIALYFFISLTLSATAFWTEDIWATRWLFGVIFVDFFSGSLFPIDVLPSWLVRLIGFTPFPYLVFYPVKIWLEQITGPSALKAIALCFGWLVIFVILSHNLLKKGLKTYGAYGS